MKFFTKHITLSDTRGLENLSREESPSIYTAICPQPDERVASICRKNRWHLIAPETPLETSPNISLWLIEILRKVETHRSQGKVIVHEAPDFSWLLLATAVVTRLEGLTVESALPKIIGEIDYLDFERDFDWDGLEEVSQRISEVLGPLDMNWIDGEIAVGNRLSAANVDLLDREGFRSVLCLSREDRGDREEYEKLGVAVEGHFLQDEVDNDPSVFYRAVQAVERLAKPLLVHCRVGRSRSVAVVTAHLRQCRSQFRGNWPEAFAYVCRRREVVQVGLWEDIWRELLEMGGE